MKQRNTNTRVGALPAAVEELLGMGKLYCPKCHGDGVRLFALGFRPCDCLPENARQLAREKKAA